MKAAELKKSCLALAGAVEEFPFGEASSVFKVAGRMFALTPLRAQPLWVNLKCDPDIAVQLRGQYPAITPGYHMNKRHWNTVLLDGSIPTRLIRELIEDSYDLVVAGLSQRQQEKLHWVGLTRG
ncbi:MAG TPA: MmcQ/YjbR family DNA-binding protein [Pseudonocardiaceae bacterium]|nr:MmcQ/YjbR family DNA-binding protein [Pseudonocardiaceae bacterium]